MYNTHYLLNIYQIYKSKVLISSDQLYTTQNHSFNPMTFTHLWLVTTYSAVRTTVSEMSLDASNNGVALDNMLLSFLICKLV